MKVNDIEKISPIDPSRLSENNYFESLVSEGMRCGLLGASETEALQLSCISLLASQSREYNNGDSSSIDAGVAEELLASALYTVGIKLKAYPTPEAAVNALKSEGMESLFVNGLRIIDRKLLSAKAIHSRLLCELIYTPNVFYRSTAEDGINGFFKLYYPAFFAKKTHITADYPTFIKINNLDGIEFIETYLKYLYRENRFCANFSPERIDSLLTAFAPGYADIPINLYEPVLATSLGCIICRRSPEKLALSAEDIEELYLRITPENANSILSSALEPLVGALSPSPGLKEYLEKSLIQITASVKSALTTHTLDKVFICIC